MQILTLACKCDSFPSQLETDDKIDIFTATCNTALLDIHFFELGVYTQKLK